MMAIMKPHLLPGQPGSNKMLKQASMVETHLMWYWVNWLVSGKAASFSFNVTWITTPL